MTFVFGSDNPNNLRHKALEDSLGLLFGLPKLQVVDIPQVNYIQVAHAVCVEVLKRRCPGILMCKTGAGMTICANKHKGIYAVACYTVEQAVNAKIINNANVLCLSSELSTEENTRIAAAFLSTLYRGRKPHRLLAVQELENSQ